MCNNWKVYDSQQAYKSYQIYIIYQVYNSYWLYNSYLVYNSYFVYDSSWVNNNVWMYDIYRLKTVIYCIIRYKNYNDCPTYFQCHKNQLPAIDWHYVHFAVQGSRVDTYNVARNIQLHLKIKYRHKHTNIHSASLDSKMNIIPVNCWEQIFVALKICGAVIIIMYLIIQSINVYNP